MATQLDSVPEGTEEELVFRSIHDITTQEAIERSHVVHCMRCKLECDPFRSVLKSKSKAEPEKSKWICRQCNAVASMMQRQMVWPPMMFSNLSDQDQQAFWVACRELSSDDSRFCYSKVKATLVKTLASKKTVEDMVETYSEPKPLSVWKSLGYDEKVIEAKGKAEACPLFGTVYSFSMKKVSTKTTVATIEEHLQKAEQAIKKNKTVGNDDDDDAIASSSDEEPAKKKQRSSGSKKKGKQGSKSSSEKATAKAEAAAAKKEQAKLVKHNQSVHTAATKAIAMLTGPLTDLTMAFDTMVGSLAGKFPQQLQDRVQENRDELKGLKDHAAEVLGRSKKADGYLDLDFDSKVLGVKLVNAKATLKNFNEMMRLVNRGA